MATTNYLAILIAALVNVVIGAFWYSPLLFGKVWMNLTGFTKKDLAKAKKKGLSKSYALSILAALVIAYVLALFVSYAKATNFLDGAMVGFWAWLGFVATIMLNGFLWKNEPFKLYILNIANYFVTFLIMGGIIAVM